MRYIVSIQSSQGGIYYYERHKTFTRNVDDAKHLTLPQANKAAHALYRDGYLPVIHAWS